MNIEVLIADYLNDQHAKDIGYLLNNYAQDPMGGGAPLSESIIENLALALSRLPHAFSVICYVDGQPAGLINCFEAFSTFACKPLINIHDLAVVSEFRGLNISQLMLAKVEEKGREKGCCKITLEVLEGNKIARNSYLKFGFDGYELDPEMGKALFWQKKI
ncbi:MAG: ribosomal protein S18 acetylase RimI-like enzyme [Motiliproteus sp.]|jgi:ribosomal protein S18 acetylase RimI-like enzyme